MVTVKEFKPRNYWTYSECFNIVLSSQWSIEDIVTYEVKVIFQLSNGSYFTITARYNILITDSLWTLVYERSSVRTDLKTILFGKYLVDLF